MANASGQGMGQGPGSQDWAGTSGEADRRAAHDRKGVGNIVKDTAYQRLGRQKERASDTLDSLAAGIRALTQQLRDDGQTGAADYITRAADGVERWAEQIRHQDIQDALRRAESFARRQPGLFLGIAFGVGVATARFLKSSGDRDYEYDRPAMGGGAY